MGNLEIPAWNAGDDIREDMLELTDATFKSEILYSPIPVIVDIWAPWCGPCRVQGPIIEALAAELKDVKVAKLNADEAMQTASTYGVMAIPTILIFKGGKVASTLVGLHRREQILEALDKL